MLLGRLGSLYDISQEGDTTQRKIVDFAIQKLLGGFDSLDVNAVGASTTPLDRTLACLSIRLPLEFDFSHPEAHDLVRKQIEHHMQLCTLQIKGTHGSGFSLPRVPSRYSPRQPPRPWPRARKARYNNYRVTCINHGERGELVAALLIMQARDALVGESGTRWVYVHDFMENLLGDSASTDSALPSFSLSGEGQRSLADTFGNARMWFNHVLKF